MGKDTDSCQQSYSGTNLNSNSFMNAQLPPPPPPLPILSNINLSKKTVTNKYKKFYWKLIEKSSPKIITSMYFNQYTKTNTLPTSILNDRMKKMLSVSIDPIVQNTLQRNFTANDRYKVKTAVNTCTHKVIVYSRKEEYLKRNTHGMHNHKVFEVLKKTNWKYYQYQDLINIFLECGKSWETEALNFASFKIDLIQPPSLSLNKYELENEFDFLEYLNHFQSYYQDKCMLTLQLQELEEVLEIFKSNLNDLTHFNNVMLEEKIALDTLITFVVKIVSLINEDVLRSNQLYCIDNLTKLKNCRRTISEESIQSIESNLVKIETILDLVYLSIKGNTRINDFLSKCINFKKDIIKENNSCFKKSLYILSNLTTYYSKKYVLNEGDRFSKYFEKEFMKIKRKILPLFEKYYHQMEIYNELIYEYQTASINKVHINIINKFKIFAKPLNSCDIKVISSFQCIEFDDNEITLMQVMREFLQDIKRTHLNYNKENTKVKERPPNIHNEIDLNGIGNLYEKIMTEDTLELLKNLKIVKKRSKRLFKTTHVSISNETLQALIKKTRAL